MVPVTERYDDFLIIFAFVRAIWVANDERRADSIGILSSDVRMVPIGPWLVNLICKVRIHRVSKVSRNKNPQVSYNEVIGE